MDDKQDSPTAHHTHCPVIGQANLEKCVCNPPQQGLDCPYWKNEVNAHAVSESKAFKIRGAYRC